MSLTQSRCIEWKKLKILKLKLLLVNFSNLITKLNSYASQYEIFKKIKTFLNS
jgi:hypothetical protein